jgi:uncharacterized OB-fold protein
MSNCPKCGADVAPDQTTCPQCGERLASAAAGAQTTCPNCSRQYDASEDACPGCGRLEAEVPCERHPDRTAAGQCVVCGSAACRECDRDETREFICPDHWDVPIVDGWAQVYTTSDDLKAQLIRENLRADGLVAEILSQKDHFAVPVDLGDLSPVRVLVPAYEYQAAIRVLGDHMDGQGEVSFACQACGESYEAGATLCAACGEPVREPDLRETL